MQINASFLKTVSPAQMGAVASAYDKWVMIAALALVSGLFFLSDDHRFGLVFLREAVIGLSLLTVIYILAAKQEVLDTIDWYLLALVALLFLIPPIFAYVSFQQPLQYGFLEERRTLLYLIYFPIMLAIGGCRGYGEPDLETILKYLFYLALAWSAANAFELIPRNAGFEFSVHAEQFADDFVATDERFATRFLEAGFLIALYPFYLVSRGEFLKAVIPLGLLAAYMLYINQTRGMSLAIVLTLVWITILRQRLSNFNVSVLLLIPVVAILGYLSYFLYVYAFNESVIFYDYHRNKELNVMLGEALSNFLMPHGALSLQFNEGFRSVYGINMYVSDIGLRIAV